MEKELHILVTLKMESYTDDLDTTLEAAAKDFVLKSLQHGHEGGVEYGDSDGNISVVEYDLGEVYQTYAPLPPPDEAAEA